jgi:hypothetical protein
MGRAIHSAWCQLWHPVSDPLPRNPTRKKSDPEAARVSPGAGPRSPRLSERARRASSGVRGPAQGAARAAS